MTSMGNAEASDTYQPSSSASECGWPKEQTESLLPDHEIEKGDCRKSAARWTTLDFLWSYIGRIGVRIWLFAVLAIFLTYFLLLPMLYTILSVWPTSSVTKDGAKQTGRTRSHDDFILDPDWDFEAQPMRREYWWTVRDTEINPDGVYRPMLLINELFPGPLIECNEGDTLIVHVDNQGVNATAFHFHGMYQNGTNWMDGTVGITQCPIPPGGRFIYEFQIDGQSGTYWYHAHQGVQTSDGLLGPLIVHSKAERQLQKLPYATDRVVMVQDHYHTSYNELLMEYLQPEKENAEPIPDGALINGMNIRDCSTLPHRKCDNSTATLPIFTLTPAQNHRLRFINVGNFAEFQIQIDEHEFAVTEVDGTDIEPVYYHRLNINPGQRYSVVVSTNITTADSFWMRARMVAACFAEEKENMEAEVRAIVRYDRGNHSMESALDTLNSLPQSVDWSEVVELICKDMNTTEFVPVAAATAPTTADSFFYLRANFEIGAYRLSRGFFNSSSWRPDVHSPSLERVIDGYLASNESFTATRTGVNELAFDVDREMVIQVDGIKTIDILVENFDDGNHPLHLHGMKFWVLGAGHGYFPRDTYSSLDLSNPLRRDTASVEAFGWLLIRLVTDNPGLWAFHCHISWHTEAGLMMQLLVRPDIVGSWTLPEANLALCKAKGLEKGTGPKDDVWMVDTD